MTSRLTRTALTFAVVLLAYLAYALIAAPLIEPTIEIVSSGWEGDFRSGGSRFDLGLFPDGAWELDQPKVLETSQGTLLFDDFKQLENGDLRLLRCTLISYIDPPESKHLPEGDPLDTAVQAQPRPVVMQASEGAVLSFDSPPNYMLGRFGRLVGGKLLGDVTIFSPASSSAGDDALYIETKNIQIDQQRIWAPSQVRFRFGRHQASGRDFSIHLAPPQHGGARKKTAMGKIRSLVLENVDQVELQVEGDLFAMVTGDRQTSLQQTPASHQTSSAQPTTPIEIKCQGPFRFDFRTLIASLEERVDVIRHNLDGPSDQLNCELLEIHLMPRKTADVTTSLPVGADPDASGNQPPKSRFGAMQPKKIIAVGFPVMIRVPSMGAGARARRMEYDFITRRVELRGGDKTIMFNEQYYVEAPSLQYELLEGGRLGRLQAAGPGLVRGQMGKKKRPFVATWAGGVSLLPQGQNKVLSLIGQANLVMADVASLKADELHLYLVEVPRPSGDQVDVHADRMQASGNIVLDSPQLIAFLADAQIWFREPTTAESVAAKADRAAGTRSSGLFGKKARSDEERPTKLRLTAGVLRGQIVLTETPQLEALDLQHNVRINEFQPVAKSALDIAAQRVVLERGNSPTAEVTLSGAPARFSAEGMTLDGDVVRVQLASNLVSVDGPGSMLILPQHVALGADGQSKPLTVHWKHSMWFDGQTARFGGEIETRGGHVTKDQETIHFVATGEVLEIVLNRPIKLTDPTTTNVDASRLSFLGLTRLDSRTADRAGTVISIDSMVVRDLVIDRQTGRVTGEGPGHVIHRGPNPQKDQNLSASQQGSGLIFLRVDFENQMVGNFDRREIEFLNGTRTILGEITEWNQSLDPQRPDLLGERSVILTSRRLAVADMRTVTGDPKAIEVEATGNAYIRGRQFAASGDRVSYISAKDQLVMEGDGRTESTLSFQPRRGAAVQHLSAKRILFYPQTGQFALEGFELELNNLGPPSPSRTTRAPAYPRPGSPFPRHSRHRLFATDPRLFEPGWRPGTKKSLGGRAITDDPGRQDGFTNGIQGL